MKFQRDNYCSSSFINNSVKCKTRDECVGFNRNALKRVLISESESIEQWTLCTHGQITLRTTPVIPGLRGGPENVTGGGGGDEGGFPVIGGGDPDNATTNNGKQLRNYEFNSFLLMK
jgi:hypothetical protein